MKDLDKEEIIKRILPDINHIINDNAIIKGFIKKKKNEENNEDEEEQEEKE